jgi:hypothetical protein
LECDDFEKLEGVIHAFFSSIPHDWYRKNELSGYEGYYASIFYEKYANAFSPIYLIGVEFSKTERNIVRFDVEKC